MLSEQRPFDGAVLSDHAFVLRWFDTEQGDRVLLVNFGTDTELTPCPEPLLAPSPDAFWETIWSSSSVIYGGNGWILPESESGWFLPAETAMLLAERSIISTRD